MATERDNSSFQLSAAFVGFVLATALVIALCSVIVDTTEGSTTEGGQTTLTQGYGFPLAFTSAQVDSNPPFNIFTNVAQAANASHWRPLAFALDTLLWVVIVGVIVAGQRLSLSIGTFFALLFVAVVFLTVASFIFG